MSTDQPPAPAAPPPPDALPPYHRTIRLLSDRIVEAQRPLRVLNAVKWDDEIERQFFADGCQVLPRVTREYYDGRPPGFDPDAKRQEFYAIERDVRRELGTLNTCGQLMLDTCKEYRVVVDMLCQRGTQAFSAISQGLYGSTLDRFHAGGSTLGDLGRTMNEILARVKHDDGLEEEERSYGAEQAVEFLKERFDAYFGPDMVHVCLDDGIVADAAAGSDYVKIRRDASFSERELGVLEVHEGWVHIGTTFNGLLQPVATFLGKGTPSSTVTQEGLAVIQEVFSFRSLPPRIRKLADRVTAITLAEEGADFLQVYRALLDGGSDERHAYQTASRAFRGCLPSGTGPFTKDLSYTRGFVLIYNFIRLAIREGLAARIPLLFLGKLRISQMGDLWELLQDGTLVPPHYLPPPYDDLRGLSAWMCYSNFLASIDLTRAADDYAALLARRS